MDRTTTEQSNPKSARIDEFEAIDIVRLMNDEDASVAGAVSKAETQIAAAIELIAQRLSAGGRLFYLGAGTSGRLGVLDASECPPTFNTPPEMVVGVIAGGSAALTRAIEAAEDRADLAVTDLRAHSFSARDVLVGIATSGRTPYVLAGLRFAHELGAPTIGITCNEDSELRSAADLTIAVVVGPEIISGSTRLKAGTATKMVLNLLSTGAMILMGKTFGNLMVDLRASNSKLLARSVRIVQTITGLTPDEAKQQLRACGGELKTTIVSQLRQISAESARDCLRRAAGKLRTALAIEITSSADAAMASASADSSRRLDADKLLIGVDGGGSKTVAWLAHEQVGESRSAATDFNVIGIGASGPSNIHVAGFEAAMQSIRRAIDEAFAHANISARQVHSICLSLAGAGRADERTRIGQWATDEQIAGNVFVATDAEAIAAAARLEHKDRTQNNFAVNPRPHGRGLGRRSTKPGSYFACDPYVGNEIGNNNQVVLISGTGSLAWGINGTGQTARAGGWGPLLGDQGSGYAIGLAGLRNACRQFDRDRGQSELLDALLQSLGLNSVEALIEWAYRADTSRQNIARLAEVVFRAAKNDGATAQIIDAAARSLTELAAVVAQKLSFSSGEFSLSLSGGVFQNQSDFGQTVAHKMSELGVHPCSIYVVRNPVLGAVALRKKGQV